MNNCRNFSGLHGAIKKYGENSFITEQIDRASNEDELNNKETYWINFYNSLVPNGYNLTTGGENPDFTEEVRYKMSVAHKGKAPHKWTEESRKRLSEAKKGKSRWYPGIGKYERTDEIREKIRNSLLGKYKGPRSPSYGNPKSEDHRMKLSKANIGNMIGEKHPRSKKFVCVETGEVFNCIREIGRIKGFSCRHISDVCLGKRNQAQGFHWKFLERTI